MRVQVDGKGYNIEEIHCWHDGIRIVVTRKHMDRELEFGLPDMKWTLHGNDVHTVKFSAVAMAHIMSMRRKNDHCNHWFEQSKHPDNDNENTVHRGVYRSASSGLAESALHLVDQWQQVRNTPRDRARLFEITTIESRYT